MKDVAVIIESSTQFGRNLMAGIAKYAALHDWRLYFEHRGLLDPEPNWLKKWHGDRIITHCPNPGPRPAVLINLRRLMYLLGWFMWIDY